MFEFPLTAVSLDDFKIAVARQTSIPAQCIITLTPHGKPLKQQTLQTEVGISSIYRWLRDAPGLTVGRGKYASTTTGWHRRCHQELHPPRDPNSQFPNDTVSPTRQTKSRTRGPYSHGRSCLRPAGPGRSRSSRTAGRWLERLRRGTASWRSCCGASTLP